MTAYRYKDGKSDKFWRIEYSENAFVVNYGKTGSIGKYQIKEFDSAEECESEVKKLVNSKEKKGYKLYSEFEASHHTYLDDEENGLHRLTSHPKFREHFTKDFYFDCGDEEAPFGSDAGADTLGQITEDIRKNKQIHFSAFPQVLIEEYWGMKYIPADDISVENTTQLVEIDAVNLLQSDRVTCATAFAQIKISGKLDGKLKVLALNAIKRREIAAALLKWNTTGTEAATGAQMINDLENFNAE